jgi:TonB-linked SusC/RagA family outer membrane protein
MQGMMCMDLKAQQESSSSDNKNSMMLTSTNINSVGQDNSRILLSNFLSTLEKHFDVTFLYKNEMMKNKYIHKDDIPIGEQTGPELSRILDRLGIAFQKIDDQTYVLLAKTTSLEDRQIQEEISGTVTDAQSGETLPGVNILVKGTTTGASTDQNGQYELSVPSLSDTLIFTYIGYQRQVVPVNGQTEVDVAMQPQAISGEEMVVVGYGTQDERDVTGSISSVSQDQISRVSVSNFEEALQGQIAGVQVTRNTGSPSAGTTIKVRGNSSITAGNEPLYVIDGHPITGGGGGTGTIPAGTNPMNNINPNNIESIDILKDASATAIYGSQGANGVVIITTKNGTEGSRITFDMSTGIQRPAKRMDRLSAEEFAEYHIESRYNGWVRSGGDPNAPNGQRPGFNVTDIYYNPDQWNRTNWQDELFRTGTIQNYDMSVSGGSSNINYYISGGYSENQGIILNSSTQRYNLRANIDAQINEKLNVSLSVSPSYALHEKQNTDNHFLQSVVGMAMNAPPLVGPYQEDGSYTNLLAMRDREGFGGTGPVGNLVAGAKEDQYDVDMGRILGNLSLEYQILDELSFKTSLGIDSNFNRTNVYQSSKTGRGSQAPPNIAEGNATSYQKINWRNENLLTYQKDFNKKHSLTAILGNTFQKEDVKNIRINGRDFAGDNVPYLNAAGEINSGAATRTQWSITSFYSRLNYDYDSRYLLTATIRRDGSSRFGEENKYGTFPSVGVSWRMSEEEFMNGATLINDLKWRFSYGVSGNNQIPNYAHIPSVSNSGYVLGSDQGRVSSTNVNSLANPFLTWETKRSYNIGFDLSLLNNRLEFTADAYKSITDGLLLNVNIPAASGFTSTYENVGEVQNKGLELSINSINSQGEFFWNSSFNISFNRNEVTALGGSGSDFIQSGDVSRTVVGKPMGLFYARVTDGIFDTQEEIDNHAPQDNNPHPGYRRFVDVNGDGVVNNQDQDFIGNPNPDFTFGFSNNMSFNGFELSFNINGSYGNDIYHRLYVGANLNGNVNQAQHVFDGRWQSPEKPGDGNTPAPVYGFSTLADTHSDYYVYDGSYIRLRNLTLAYNIPTSLSGKIGFKNAKFTLSGKNLYTITNYPGFDPELGASGSNALNFGKDLDGVYPLARVFTAGFSITF